MNTTWVRHANRLEEENNGLKKLLEEALDHIDQYDYEESFDLVQRIKDALNHTRMDHPPVIPWSDSGLTEKEELLQKVQQLERDKVKMLADLQVESEINAKGGEREYVLRGKVEQLQRENAALHKLLDTHILRSDLFSYLAWLEDHRDHGDFELEGSKYLVLASDGTTCWGTTFMEAVQIAEQHDRAAFDAARAKEAKP